PHVTTHLEVENGRIARLAFEQKDPAPRRGLVWAERMEVVLGYDETSRRIPIALNAPRVEVTTARGLPAPRFVLATGGGLGYGGCVSATVRRDDCVSHAAS